MCQRRFGDYEEVGVLKLNFHAKAQRIRKVAKDFAPYYLFLAALREIYTSIVS